MDQVLDQLFEFGSESLDRVAFQKALDDIGATESAGTDFSVNVLTNFFDRGVQLLADNLLHPALPDEAFKTVRQERVGHGGWQLESPDYLRAPGVGGGVAAEGRPGVAPGDDVHASAP